MAVIAKVDRVDLLEAQERDGVVIRLVTRARVTGLTDTGVAALTSALATPGIPQAEATLSGYPQLVLRDRNPQVVEEDRTIVDIDLVYEHFDNEGQSFAAPFTSAVVGQIRASVQQSSTNIDIFNKLITVEHTYTDDQRKGKKETQGGTVQFLQAQRTISFTGIKVSVRPWLIANQLIGHLNELPWQGQAVHEWICTGVNWDILTVAGKHNMTFDFQHNPDTWNPTVIFIDDRDGKPPKDLVAGTGFKTIRKHPEVNFERIIGVRLQGS